MKRGDWRRIRRGEALPEHELARQPLTELTKTVSEEMGRALRRIASSTDHLAAAQGTGIWLSAIAVSMHTLEALWRRALVTVKWNRVPLHAPITVKVDRVEATERGRALLAALDLARPREVEATINTLWTVPPGTKAVQVTGHGGGGGGGGSSRSYGGAGGSTPGAAGQAGASIGGGKGGAGGAGGNGSVSIAFTQQAVHHVPVTPGETYGVHIGAGGKGGKKGT